MRNIIFISFLLSAIAAKANDAASKQSTSFYTNNDHHSGSHLFESDDLPGEFDLVVSSSITANARQTTVSKFLLPASVLFSAAYDNGSVTAKNLFSFSGHLHSRHLVLIFPFHYFW